MTALFIGIFLMALGAGRLSETNGSYFAYFGGAAAVSVLVQALVVWRHNRRLSPETGHDALPDTPGRQEK